MKMFFIRLWFHHLRPWIATLLRPINRIRYASVLRWAVYDCGCQCELANFATPQEAAAWMEFLGGGEYFIWPTIDGLEIVSNTPNPDWSITLKNKI